MLDYNDEREKRIEIFFDTLWICIRTSLKNDIAKSIENQRLIRENTVIETAEKRYERPSEIVVSTRRTLEAAEKYAGKKVCILNFASATNPGGGVKKGSNAQEECICRCTTLYPCLNDDKMLNSFYNAHRTQLKKGKMTALYNDDCIYTPNVCVIKSDTKFPVELTAEKRFFVDVITCAAPNLRSKPSNAMNPNSGKVAVKIKNDELKALHTRRANRILDIARTNNAEVVIMGAFGCGAFQNPPEIVAAGIKEAVENHRYDFETIEFAIYCKPNGKDSYNFQSFRKVFENKNN